MNLHWVAIWNQGFGIWNLWNHVVLNIILTWLKAYWVSNWLLFAVQQLSGFLTLLRLVYRFSRDHFEARKVGVFIGAHYWFCCYISVPCKGQKISKLTFFTSKTKLLSNSALVTKMCEIQKKVKAHYYTN
jgi:hypothetical protein